ncbi:hypothetical protein FNV43_RR23796 [Rhamnella rubrinervis]|uniref:Uncharacterized protein n=1 Tax=Rhamnella rubrinervis TaxID=2594499 RepID=A0A8K0DR95_9ROSA|nr:hypothetical protein FNV43_RR23796 [Rhamnella rubrinervis]
MGIPSFYRWLLDRYPRTVVDAIEEAAGDGGGPMDTSRPNPNGLEYDNLYLDMNGIIHPCFHPEGLPAPKTYDEVFQAVFKYIDKIFSIVRPRKLLFLAIDGVAPRAKMNQQRSRRFKAAKDAADEVARIETPGNVYELKEENSTTSLEQPSNLDSNVITPGTEFMSLLSSALRYFIHLRMNGDLGWRGLKVILSDANVPGEGEHKIMSYIRLQRNLSGFDPNTRHCLYGLDADLIMLALATHEIHFSILREDVQHKSLKSKSSKSLRYSSMMGEVRTPSEKMQVFSENLEDYISNLRFQFLNIWVLRDYLALDMKLSGLKVEVDLERLVDDFVFMCLFVGNDFLPHIPSLEISEGAIDLLMMIYKSEFARMGGYLTSSFEVNLERVQLFVQALGLHECAIFRKRSQIQKQREQRFRHSSNNKIVSQSSKKLRKAQVGQDPTNIQKQMEHHFQHSSNNKIVSQSSKKLRKAQVGQDTTNPSVMEIQAPNNSALSGMDTVVDKIKLGEEGWKERYYAEKFEAKTEEERERTRNHLVLKYVEGVCWVMHYYYEGVCSWQWFYPYHYAPFASDFYDIDILKIQFTLGQPFKPFDQLMAVLPAASAHALPLSYRKLMTDNLSPLLDFYPTEFELDMNGKRFSWQAICKLPFIEESRLLSEIARVEQTLTDEERQRNNLGLDVLFVHLSNPLAVNIVSFFRNNVGLKENPKTEARQKIDPSSSGGMNGFMVISDKHVQPMEIYSPIEGMEIIANNEVLSIFYECPPFHPHIPRVPEGVNLPAKSISKKDILPPPILWHQKTAVVGRIHSERPQICNSIYGPRLAKLAHELLSKFYLAKWQNTVECMKHIGHVSANGITSCRGSQTVCVEGTGRTKKRKRRRKRGSSDAINLPDNDVGVNNGPMANLKLGEKLAVSGYGGDKSHSNERSNEQGNGIPNKNLGAEEVVVESQKRKRKRKRSKQNDIPYNHVVEDGPKQTKGSDIPDENEGAVGLACHSNLVGRVFDGRGDQKFVEVDSQKQKHMKGNDVADDHVEGDGLACSNLREAITPVGAVHDGNCIDGNKILDNHVDEDGQTKGSGIPDDHVGVVGVACNTELEERIRLDGAEGEKVVVESQKSKRRRKRRKGNGIPENLVSGDGLDGNRILEYNVAEVGQKQTEGSGILADHVAADGLACNTDLKERNCLAGAEGDKVVVETQKPENLVIGGDGADASRILEYHVAEDGQKQTGENAIPTDHVGIEGLACYRDFESLAGTEGEKVEVESRKPRRKRKRKRGNGIPENHVGGDEVNGIRILEYHVAEDGQKQTERNGIPADLAAVDGLACNTDFVSLAGIEVEKVDVESRKPRRKRKRKKGNGIRENIIGDRVDGNRVLEHHAAEDEQKQTEGCSIPADHVRADGLACSADFESLVGTEGEIVEVESQKPIRERILEYHAAEDGRKQTEGSCIPADHVCAGADGLVCNTDFESVTCTEGEKVEVESRKPIRKRNRRKGKGIPENLVEGDGVDGNRILANHEAEDVRKQTEGSGIPADHVGVDRLACNTDMEERICLAGAEGEKTIIESRKPKRKRKRRKENGIPENLVGGDGLACSNTRVAITVDGTESNRNFLDGNRILDNLLAEDELKQTKRSSIPDDHGGEDGLTCHSNLVGKSSVGAGGEKSVVVKFQEQKGNEGCIVADNHVRGDGLACSNLKEAITTIGTGYNGNCIDSNKILGNHVAEVGQKQTSNGIPDDHVDAHGIASHS